MKDLLRKAETLTEALPWIKEAWGRTVVIKYGGAVHSFTDWKADGSMKGAKYDEKADQRSWEDMKAFFAEVLK